MEIDKPYIYSNDTIVVSKGKNQITGWMISTQKYSELEILIDGEKVNANIERFERWDIHDKNKGYGGAITTPYPGYRTYVDFGKFESGTEHTVQIRVKTNDKKILAEKSFKVVISNLTYGIDVSTHNGYINWQQVEKTQDFAIIRIGYRGYQYGTLQEDNRYIQNLMGAQSAGIKIGAYFYTQAINEDEAREEANWMADRLSKYNITYPVIIDTEYSKDKTGRADNISVEQRTKNMLAFIETIQNRGYKGAIYASKYWLKDMLDEDKLANCDIWVAHYTNDINNTTDYDRPYAMWQYTSNGVVQGINGDVDMNVCYKYY